MRPIDEDSAPYGLERNVDEGEKIELMEEIGEVLDGAMSSNKEKAKKKKMKLLFIGDSLSACVGVTDPTDGLVLQKTTATLIQEATGSDVEWYNTAVVGGTVKDIRERVDAVKTQFLNGVRADEELVVVIICGLNDYKSFVLSLWNPWMAARWGPSCSRQNYFPYFGTFVKTLRRLIAVYSCLPFLSISWLATRSLSSKRIPSEFHGVELEYCMGYSEVQHCL